jgi:hypothetical protein
MESPSLRTCVLTLLVCPSLEAVQIRMATVFLTTRMSVLNTPDQRRMEDVHGLMARRNQSRRRRHGDEMERMHQ